MDRFPTNLALIKLFSPQPSVIPAKMKVALQHKGEGACHPASQKRHCFPGSLSPGNDGRTDLSSNHFSLLKYVSVYWRYSRQLRTGILSSRSVSKKTYLLIITTSYLTFEFQGQTGILMVAFCFEWLKCCCRCVCVSLYDKKIRPKQANGRTGQHAG